MSGVADLFERVTGLRCARRELGDRGRLGVSGEDRVRFLNGMISNDVAALRPGERCYATLLDRKGHVLADLFALAREREILLDTTEGRGALVREALEKHVIADQVEIEDRTGTWDQLSLEGPGAGEAAASAGLPRPAEGRAEEAAGGLVVVGAGTLMPEGLQILGPSAAVEAVRARLALPELAPEHALILRIESFLPEVGVDVTERSLPQEARLDHALSFTKGCFVGQEIVARLEHRGGVKRLLVQLAAERPVRAGDPIRAEGREVGQVTSAAVSPVRGPLALGYIKVAFAGAGARVDVGDVPAVVQERR